MYVQLLMLGGILLGVLIFKGKNEESFGELDSSEHPLKVMYPFALVLYRLVKKTGKEDVFGRREVLREVFINESPELSQRIQGCKCIASILAVIAITCFISFAYEYANEPALVDGRYLKRFETGAGEAEYELYYDSDALTEKEETTVSVSEVRLTGGDLEELKKKAQDYLDRQILGNNVSAVCVQEPLVLVEEIPRTGISVKWDEEDSWFVSYDGSLKNEEFEEPVEAVLHAKLFYFDEEWEYTLPICILPPVVLEADVFKKEVQASLEEQDRRKPEDLFFELPLEVENQAVVWEEPADTRPLLFMVLGLIAAIAVIPGLKQDIRKKQKKRTEQMMRDYSDIVSKFTMLLTAGMTCRGAWEKICTDYMRSKKREEEHQKHGGKRKKKSCTRFAYEEMMVSFNELRLGTPETRVYEKFGTRCNLLAYQRFGTMLSRNLRRGSAGIIDMLELEAHECFAERRENVRRKGEETGTKLLIPMFGMLIIVLAIVVVPAFSSF